MEYELSFYDAIYLSNRSSRVDSSRLESPFCLLLLQLNAKSANGKNYFTFYFLFTSLILNIEKSDRFLSPLFPVSASLIDYFPIVGPKTSFGISFSVIQPNEGCWASFPSFPSQCKTMLQYINFILSNINHVQSFQFFIVFRLSPRRFLSFSTA